MNNISSLNKVKIFWVINLIGWTIFTALIIQIYVADLSTDFQLAVHYAIRYFIAFLVSIQLAYFYNKINYFNQSIISIILMIVGLLIYSGHLWIIIEILKEILIYQNQELLSTDVQGRYFHDIYWNIFYLWLWSAFYFGVKFWLDWQGQKSRNEDLQILARNARLKMLRYQLNPHFLFNSLNSIKSLISENEDKAKEMILELKKFLSYSLNEDAAPEVTIGEEINSVEHYLAIEKIRYEEKLDIQYDIDPESKKLKIVGFLLHPIVENAVKFGMRTSELPLKILIKTVKKNGKLLITVSNTGKWLEKQNERIDSAGTGTGIKNIQQRLKSAYPYDHTFKISKFKDRVEINIELTIK